MCHLRASKEDVVLVEMIEDDAELNDGIRFIYIIHSKNLRSFTYGYINIVEHVWIQSNDLRNPKLPKYVDNYLVSLYISLSLFSDRFSGYVSVLGDRKWIRGLLGRGERSLWFACASQDPAESTRPRLDIL